MKLLDLSFQSPKSGGPTDALFSIFCCVLAIGLRKSKEQSQA